MVALCTRSRTPPGFVDEPLIWRRPKRAVGAGRLLDHEHSMALPRKDRFTMGLGAIVEPREGAEANGNAEFKEALVTPGEVWAEVCLAHVVQ
jgi:hypothetical protein